MYILERMKLVEKVILENVIMSFIKKMSEMYVLLKHVVFGLRLFLHARIISEKV
jgi:hypothetical protein